MKIYRMKKRMINPLSTRNAVGWKYPFFEATVDGNILQSMMIDPSKDSKSLGRAFSWGYKGVYPLNLSISILCDFFDFEDYTKLFSDDGFGYASNKFYRIVVRDNKRDGWKITEEQIWRFMDKSVKELEQKGII